MSEAVPITDAIRERVAADRAALAADRAAYEQRLAVAAAGVASGAVTVAAAPPKTRAAKRYGEHAEMQLPAGARHSGWGHAPGESPRYACQMRHAARRR